MPTPRENETRNEFMKRCIPMRKSEHPSEKNEQSVAVCLSIYREHQKKSKASKHKKKENK
jgi:hypothetical protein